MELGDGTTAGITDGLSHGDWTMDGEEHMTGMEMVLLIGEMDMDGMEHGMEVGMEHGMVPGMNQ